LRFAFTGQIAGFDPTAALDEGILRAVWMSVDEIAETQHRHRSPLLQQCVTDYLAGQRYPLDLLMDFADAFSSRPL
jgi:hypothetical protein